ncbi:AraC family transcriptional regulator [Hoeflea sp. TYP-13]|uniref:AraC family transcriptional regulator n=1 Tax=Hoeflea sp. TYP-13 TaxID=3230023 RepID=UPI0034C5F57B
MTAPPRQPPPPNDPIGETLHLLRLSGSLYCRAELTAPWCVDMPPFEGMMMFHVVTAGRCWLEIDGHEPLLLTQGSMTLVPHGAGHRIRSGPEADARPLFDVPVEQVSERYEIMRYGGGGEFTHATCGVMRFDHVAAERLIASLPRVLHVDSWDHDEGGWLQSTLRFISREASMLRPGGETVITRLADILVIQAIRSWLDSAPEAKQGWLAALRDEQVGRALASIHRAPQEEWTVASLAREAGMSRSAFSARFTELVGEPAMRYLTWWRMQLARTQLQETSEPLTVIANRLGYQSEAAFCRAFKRVFGVPPGSVRGTAPTYEGQTGLTAA